MEHENDKKLEKICVFFSLRNVVDRIPFHGTGAGAGKGEMAIRAERGFSECNRDGSIHRNGFV